MVICCGCTSTTVDAGGLNTDNSAHLFENLCITGIDLLTKRSPTPMVGVTFSSLEEKNELSYFVAPQHNHTTFIHRPLPALQQR